MAFDDERGRTGSFSASLLTPTSHPGGQGGGGTNFQPPGFVGGGPQFLGGSEAGNFLSGGADGGFTNFSQYLYANPGGAGQADLAARTGGQAGLDSAMNNAYGVHAYGDPNAGTAAAQPPPDPNPIGSPYVPAIPPPPNVTPSGSGGQQYGAGGVNEGGAGAPGDDRHHNQF